jgi:argininosuccinate lyase
MDKHGTITSDNHAALWHGRFQDGPDAQAVAFETSIHDDEKNGCRRHSRKYRPCAYARKKTRIIPQNEADEIAQGLESIEKDLLSGALKIDYSAEDIHSFIEATLTDRIGEAGKKVHTGRSRNDQVALDERLYLRRSVPGLQKQILVLVKTLSDIAEKHQNDLIPGFTHMQHAQPVTLAHHLCAWAWMFTRDYGRLEDALGRISLSPIGACALAGSGLPLDRKSGSGNARF